LENDLTWSYNTKDLLKKAQQRLYFLTILRKNCLPQDLLLAFYHCSIESVLTYGRCVWYGSSTSSEKKVFHRVVRSSEKTIGCPLTTLEQIYTSRCHRKAMDISKDSCQLLNIKEMRLLPALAIKQEIQSNENQDKLPRKHFLPQSNHGLELKGAIDLICTYIYIYIYYQYNSVYINTSLSIYILFCLYYYTSAIFSTTSAISVNTCVNFVHFHFYYFYFYYLSTYFYTLFVCF